MPFIDELFDAMMANLREAIIEIILKTVQLIYAGINGYIGQIATEAGETPAGWNAGVFSTINSISQSVILPIAAIIITYVLCWELIELISEKNNMHDIDTWIIFKFVFKAWIFVSLTKNAFNIAMAFFDVAQHVVSSAAGLNNVYSIDGQMMIDMTTVAAGNAGAAEDFGSLFLLMIVVILILIIEIAVAAMVMITIYTRMFEIFLYCSVAPIPIATMGNKEWNIGNNYIKALLALGFQGFFIMVCLAIYTSLIQSLFSNPSLLLGGGQMGLIGGEVGSVFGVSNAIGAFVEVLIYTFLLYTGIQKTGSVSKSIFNAH